jgi:hypothetical protein
VLSHLGHTCWNGRPVAAKELLNTCEARLRASNDSAWALAADIVRIAAEDRPDLLTAQFRTRVQNQKETSLALALSIALARLADRKMSQLAADHLSVVQQICTVMRTSEATLSLIYAPFFCGFWERMLAAGRFRFIQPKLLEMSLGEFKEARRDEASFRSLMRALASTADLRALPDYLRAWLNRAESGPTYP